MRIKLKNIELKDADFLFSLYGNKEYMKYFGSPYSSLIEVEKSIINHVKSISIGIEIYQIIIDDITKEKVGCIRVYLNEDKMSFIEFCSSKNHQGKGYITEALRRLLKILEYNELPIVYATVLSLNNFGALKILYNAGFQDYCPVVSTLNEPIAGIILSKQIIKDPFVPNDKSINESYTYFLKADAAEEIGDYETALELYDKAIKINPKNSNAHGDKGYVLLKNEHPYWQIKAVQSFTSALLIDDKIQGMYHNRALGKYGSINYFGATLDCIKDIELFGNKDSYFLLGVCLCKLGDYENGKMNLIKAHQLGHERALNIMEKLIKREH